MLSKTPIQLELTDKKSTILFQLLHLISETPLGENDFSYIGFEIVSLLCMLIFVILYTCVQSLDFQF